MNPKFLIAFLIFTTLISVVARLFPHPPNFAPIAALALFAGVYASKTSKWYLLLPLGVMLVSDLFVGFYEPRTMAVVYASFFAIGLIGLLVQKSKSASWRIGALTLATLTGSIIFYLTTNFAVWAFSGMYAPTLGGLFLSYYMAIPFFKFTLLGDLFYVSLFFGSYALAQSLAFRYQSLKGVLPLLLAMISMVDSLNHEGDHDPHIPEPVPPQLNRTLIEVADVGTTSLIISQDEQGRLQIGVRS